MRYPSVKTIMGRLDMGKDAAKYVRSLMDETRELTQTEIDSLPHRGRNVEVVMELFHRVLDGYGVESIRDSDYWDSYYADNRIMYVNMGDTYHTTILFDTKHNRYYVGSWGDYIEERERRNDGDFA